MKLLKQKEVKMDPKKRFDVKVGLKVNIVLKADQRTGKLTQGVVKDILTNSPTHPHGIKDYKMAMLVVFSKYFKKKIKL